jgi:hypothetical protein
LVRRKIASVELRASAFSEVMDNTVAPQILTLVTQVK